MSKKYMMAWMKAENPYKSIKPPVEDDLYLDDVPPTDESEDELFSGGDDKDFLQEKDGVKQVDALFTPLGIIVLDEYTDTYRLFNFWICHTNFDLTEGISDVIEETPGVEVLHVFTRYRFRIAVAKYWKPSEVFSEIRKNILKYMKRKEKAEKIKKMVENAKQ